MDTPSSPDLPPQTPPPHPDSTVEAPERQYRFNSPASIVAILVLVVMVGAILAFTILGQRQAEQMATEAETSSGDVRIEMQLKIIVAFAEFQPVLMQQQLDALTEEMKSPADKRATAALIYFLDERVGRSKALGILDEIEEPGPLDQIMRPVISGESTGLTSEEKTTLTENLGWAGKLLVATQDDALRAEVSQEALRVGIIISLGTFALIGLVLLGCILFFLALAFKQKGKLNFRLRRESAFGPLYLEAFAVYLTTMVLASVVLQGVFAVMANSAAPSLFMFGNLLVVAVSLFTGVCWPLVRGVPLATLREEMGLHAGGGFLKEAFLGVVGYVALLPVMGLGLTLTVFLNQVTTPPDSEPTEITHPIMDQMSEITLPGMLMILALASVLVPITEETMFRGALYRSMRSRLGITIALLIVAFLFAVIHPQGLLAVPALMGMAVAFGLIREWRDSLVGPIVAHGLHNGTLLVMVYLLAM